MDNRSQRAPTPASQIPLLASAGLRGTWLLLRSSRRFDCPPQTISARYLVYLLGDSQSPFVSRLKSNSEVNLHIKWHEIQIPWETEVLIFVIIGFHVLPLGQRPWRLHLLLPFVELSQAHQVPHSWIFLSAGLTFMQKQGIQCGGIPLLPSSKDILYTIWVPTCIPHKISPWALDFHLGSCCFW